MRNILLLTISVFLFTSCQDNAKQKEEEQKHLMDSVATATKNIETKKNSLRSQIECLQKQASELKQKLNEKIANLQVAEDKLRSIEEFHLLRTSSERQAEIKAQSLVILNLQDDINATKKNLNDTEEQLMQLASDLKKLN